MWRTMALILISLCFAGCSVSAPVAEERPWAVPPPSPTDVSDFDLGPVDKRPIIRKFHVENLGSKNGWLVVSNQQFTLSAEVAWASKVTFMGFDPDTELLNPVDNGIVESARQKDGNMWTVKVLNFGSGQRAALYAVVENDHGRTVSSPIYVVWTDQ